MSSDKHSTNSKPSFEDDAPLGLHEASVVAEGEERVTLYMVLLAMAASFSGLLFGYDTGYISGALVIIGDDLGQPLTRLNIEWITSVLTVGALVGGLSAGVSSDRFGRKTMLLVSDVLFIIGAITQTAAQNLAAMYAGRLVMGFGVGLASCVCPLFIGEVAPTLQRGRLTTMNVVAITLGQVIAYGIGAAFNSVNQGWRYVVAAGIIPAAVQLCLMHYLPESPRYLLKVGKEEQARRVLRRVYPAATIEQLDLKISVIQAVVIKTRTAQEAIPATTRFLNMFRVGKTRRALAIACGLQALQQLSGFNSLIYYSSSLFATIGFENPTAVGLIIAATNFVMTCVALQIIDRVGRRKIMLVSSLGMVCGLALASISFHFLTRSTNGELIAGSDYPASWSAIVIVSMVLYVALYAIGTGNVPWLQGELFGIESRGLGTSLATATNWSGNLIISSTYLQLLDAITPTGTFAFYAGICFVGFIFIVFCYPETCGLSLEETQSIFTDNFGVKASRELRQAKQDIRSKHAQRV